MRRAGDARRPEAARGARSRAPQSQSEPAPLPGAAGVALAFASGRKDGWKDRGQGWTRAAASVSSPHRRGEEGAAASGRKDAGRDGGLGGIGAAAARMRIVSCMHEKTDQEGKSFL